MIARKSALTFLNSVVGGLLGLVALRYITLYLDPSVLGAVVFAMSGLGLAYFVTDLGLGSAHVKRVSEGLDEGDCFVTFLTFKVAATAVFVAGGLGFLLYWRLFQPSWITTLQESAFLLILAYYATTALRSAFQSTFDAKQQAARSAVALFTETLVRVVAAVAIIFVIAAVNRNAGPLLGVVTPENPVVRFIVEHEVAMLAFSYTIAGVVSLAVAFAQVRAARLPKGRFRWDILKSYWTFALPLFLLLIIGTVSSRIDALFLGFFWGATENGLLAPAQQLRIFLEAIPYAVGALLFPAFSAMDARGDWDSIRATTEKGVRYLGMIMLPITLFVAAFAPALTHVFLSDKYLPGAAAISLLAMYAFVIGLMRPYFALVSGAGRSAMAAKVGVLMTVSNIVFNVLLIPADIKALGIPLFGLKMTGAALATLLSGVLGFALLWWYARQVAGRAIFPLADFARQVASALVMTGALLALHSVAPFDRWFDFLVYMALGGALYFATLFVLRGFHKRDLDLLLGVASVPEMLRYLRSELSHRK